MESHVGTIITGSGAVDATFADVLPSEDEEEHSQEEDQAASSEFVPDITSIASEAPRPTEESEAPAPLGLMMLDEGRPDSNSVTVASVPGPRTSIQTTTSRSSDSSSTQGRQGGGTSTPTGTISTSSSNGSTSRTNRRPRAASPSKLPSLTSPRGEPLGCNPARASTDARERERNPSLSTVSNRLGGVDLRVVRDNFESLGGTFQTARGKRSAPDNAASTPTFASSKRVRAKKRMDQMETELSSIQEAHAAEGSEMTKLLLFFREDADRRADSEARRRREDREGREAAEKQEREQRENDRRSELAAADARLQQQREDERLRREEEARRDAASRLDREQERAEERRRYEERMERERIESQQRHEQMMALLGTNLAKSKQRLAAAAPCS